MILDCRERESFAGFRNLGCQLGPSLKHVAQTVDAFVYDGIIIPPFSDDLSQAFLLFRAKKRVPFLGVSWAFLALLPALLFPLVTYMADRYLYAPSLGFC